MQVGEALIEKLLRLGRRGVALVVRAGDARLNGDRTLEEYGVDEGQFMKGMRALHMSSARSGGNEREHEKGAAPHGPIVSSGAGVSRCVGT